MSAAALPQLKGFGTVKDLRVAMTGDSTLEGLVDDFAALTTTDLALLKADAANDNETTTRSRRRYSSGRSERK